MQSIGVDTKDLKQFINEKHTVMTQYDHIKVHVTEKKIQTDDIKIQGVINPMNFVCMSS